MKRSIISLYDADLRKIDSTGRASLLFNNIPAQLSHGGSRYQVSSVIEIKEQKTFFQYWKI